MSAPWDEGAALIAHQVRDAFADADAARMRELDRLIAAGYANTEPRHIPDAEGSQTREDAPCAWHPFLAWW